MDPQRRSEQHLWVVACCCIMRWIIEFWQNGRSAPDVEENPAAPLSPRLVFRGATSKKKVPKCFIHASKSGLCCDRMRWLYSRTGGNKVTPELLVFCPLRLRVQDSFLNAEPKGFVLQLAGTMTDAKHCGCHHLLVAGSTTWNQRF